jgi:hypothetical protein
MNISKITVILIMIILEKFVKFTEKYPTEWDSKKLIYFLITVLLTVLQPVIDGLILYCLDYLYKFNLLDYLMYSKYKFTNRRDNWILNNYIIDISLDKKYRSLDLLCFSDQFYFMVSLGALGIILNIFAMQIMSINKYSAFKDPFSMVFLAIVAFIFRILNPVARMFEKLLKLWDKKKKRDNKQFNLRLSFEGYMMSSTNIHTDDTIRNYYVKLNKGKLAENIETFIGKNDYSKNEGYLMLVTKKLEDINKKE